MTQATPPPDPTLAATVYEKLRGIRAKKDLTARPTKHLKLTFTALDGTDRPLKLRYYQVQGVMHLLAMKRFLLGDDTGLGKCVTRDTLVLTDRGLLEIGDLGPKGDLPPDTFHPLPQPTSVWTGWRWAPVKSFYVSGWKPTLRLRTRRGYEIEGSLVHPLWVRPAGGREVFVQIGDLSLGEHVCLSRELSGFPSAEPQIPTPDPTTFSGNARGFSVPGGLTPDLAALLGYVVAEGWTASRWGFTITQHRNENPEVHDHIRRLCEVVLGWVGDEGNKSRDTTINVSSVYLREYFLGLGVGYDLSASKCVPWPIFQGTQDSLISFLRAFFDGEGSVTGGTVEVTSASERMLREVQILLLRLGIVCTRSRKKVRGRDHTYWRLAICGDDARIFAAQVGFLTPRKAQALSELVAKVSNTNLDVVPHARKAIRELRTELVKASARSGSNASRKGSGLKQFGVSFEKTLNNIEVADRDPSYNFLEKLLRVAEQLGVVDTPAYLNLCKVMSSHFFYDPVVEITKGENELVDIEVDDPNHSFVANGIVSHNTLESIAALCYLWERTPNLKVIILTTKSALEQWKSEFSNFTTGVQVFVSRGTPVQRRKARDEYEKATGPAVLIMGYRSAVQDFSDLQNWSGYVFITDEATAYKNNSTQVHQVCHHLSSKAERTWALTATLIKNSLIEGWGIYQVVAPGLFGNKSSFLNEYCITRMQTLPGSRRQIPVIVGYRERDVRAFRDKIDPFFLGRPKFEVASELPPLVTRHVKCSLTKFQQEKYAEALAGLLEVGKEDSLEEKEVTKLTAVTYCQQIVNHPELIGCEGDSDKLDTLIDLLTEGELSEEKVIVFSRFRKMVDLMLPALAKAGVHATRITGFEDEKARKKAQDSFQDPNSKIRVVCITTAASEAINLQAAKAIIFYDTPWSAGDYLQLLGRMIRIGSTHDRCYALHLVAEGTIDDRVTKVMGTKMALVEKVLGKRIKGEADADMVVSVENDLSDLFNALVQDAKRGR
jgi:intein/homing endonuclease